MILFFPEDLRGDHISGPSSIWASEGFQLLQNVGEAQRGAASFCQFAGTEHRRPTGIPTNVKGLARFLYVGWPNHQVQANKLVYFGPLPRRCPCVSDHPPMPGEIERGFHSNAAHLLTSLFWARLVAALSPVSGNVALRDGTTVFTTSPSSLSSLLRSASSSPIGAFPGSLSVLFSRWAEGALSRTVLRDFAASSGELDGFCSWDANRLPFLDSRTPLVVFVFHEGKWGWQWPFLVGHFGSASHCVSRQVQM